MMPELTYNNFDNFCHNVLPINMLFLIRSFMINSLN